MREPKEIELNEITYKLYPLSPFKSSAILTRILKVIGGPIGQLVSKAKEENPSASVMDTEVGPELIGKALEALTQNLEEKEVEKLMKDLLPTDLLTFSKGGEDFKKVSSLEGHLNKNGLGIMHLFKLVKFSLEVNYSDFLGEIAELKG